MISYVLALLMVVEARYYEDWYREWFSGVDLTVNRQSHILKIQYPVKMVSHVLFPFRFARRPQVLLLHEELEWEKNADVDYDTYASDVSLSGFYMNYYIGGPALVPLIRVRWIAIVDPEVEVQYVRYSYYDLFELRGGVGTRFQEFLIDYEPKITVPRITGFIVGARMEVYDSLLTSIQVYIGKPSSISTLVRISTRDRCHILKLRMAFLITTDYSLLIQNMAANANYYNQFALNDNRMKNRVQRFWRSVPNTFYFRPNQNIMAIGIQGFEVHTRRGQFYLTTQSDIIGIDSVFYCYYGTSNLLTYFQEEILLQNTFKLDIYCMHQLIRITQIDNNNNKYDQLYIIMMIYNKSWKPKFIEIVTKIIQANRLNKKQTFADTQMHQFQEVDAGQESNFNYLVKFIEITEGCLNNPNKSATGCSDLIMHISQLLSQPKKWDSTFWDPLMKNRNEIDEKINQFLQNAILIIENQKSVQKIVIMALTNLVQITEPKENPISECCMKVLKTLYLNNPELQPLLKDSIQQNVIKILEQDSYLKVSNSIFRGLIDFTKEIDIGSWFSEHQGQILGQWLQSIFACFIDKKVNNKEIIERLDLIMNLISKCASIDTFSNLIHQYITIEGSQAILEYCIQYEEPPKKASKDLSKTKDVREQKELADSKKTKDADLEKTKKPDPKKKQAAQKAEDILVKNKILVYLLEMISCINDFFVKSPKGRDAFEKYMVFEIKLQMKELVEQKFDFKLSLNCENPEQCQFMNKKLGRMIKIYGMMIQTDNAIQSNDVVKFVCNIMVQRKIDPFIYGSACQFMYMLLNNQASYSDESFNVLVLGCESFVPLLNLISINYKDLLVAAQVYGQFHITADMNIKTMPSKELQYCISAIMDLLKLLKKQQSNSKHPQINKFINAQQVLNNANYKHIILQGLLAPVEQIRMITCFLLKEVDPRMWEIEDIKLIFQILDQLKIMLIDSLGEEEISTLMMILCKIVVENSEASKTFLSNEHLSVGVLKVALNILRANMTRQTSHSETKQKVDLAACCVFLIERFLVYIDLRKHVVSKTAIAQICESMIQDDLQMRDGVYIIGIEYLTLVMQPLFNAIEKELRVSSYHLGFFRILNQINRILDFSYYDNIANNGYANNSNYDKLSPDSILDEFFERLYQSCKEHCGKWLINNFDITTYKNINDLESSFEVQHTIFSTQNGIDRILMILCKTPMKQIPDVKISLESILSNKQVQQIDLLFNKNQYNKHSLYSYLVGYKNTIDPTLFESQFFETIQNKKTMANGLVDIKNMSIDDFHVFIMDQQKSQKTKFALTVSAFFFAIYNSIVHAAQDDLRFVALFEAQQKEKLIGFIQLCGYCEWYNCNVSLKLLKVQRLILRYVLQTHNEKSALQYKVLLLKEEIKQIKTKFKNLDEQKREENKILNTKIPAQEKQNEIDLKIYYQTPIQPNEQLENCWHLAQMASNIFSDFSEIVDCLTLEQLELQLKLINAIFKSLQLVFKQLFKIAYKIQPKDQNDQQNTFHSILMKIGNIIISDQLLDGIIQCIRRLDKKLEKIQNPRYLEKLEYNIAQTLGQFYTLKSGDLKIVFGKICYSFDSERLQNIINKSIQNWILDMSLIKLHSFIDQTLPVVYQHVHLYAMPMNFGSLDKHNYKQCFLIIYNTKLLIIDLINIKTELAFLQNEFSIQNIQIIKVFEGEQIKEVDIKTMNTEQDEDDKSDIRGIEVQIQGEKDEPEVYSLYFQTGYLCHKVLKIFRTLIQDKYNSIR